MIVKIPISGNQFDRKKCLIRGGEGELYVSNSEVVWAGKWQAILHPDRIECTSFRTTSDGVNVISFEVNLSGYSKLMLSTTKEGKKLIRSNKVFEKQSNMDGDLYLIYNGVGFRSAYFHSVEYLDLLKKYDLVNAPNRNPNDILFRDKIEGDNDAKLTRVGDLEIYAHSKRIVTTDGKIIIKDLSQTVKQVSICDATWAIIEKHEKSRLRRVLISQKSIFELKLPKQKTREKRREKMEFVSPELLSYLLDY